MFQRIVRGLGVVSLLLAIPLHAQALSSVSADSVFTNYSSTNVTTSAALVLYSSVAHPVREVHIFDSSGQTMKITVTSGAYVTNVFIPPGGLDSTLKISQGDSVSIIAVSATASAGINITTLLY